MAEPYTLGEIDTFRRVLPADARWVATVDARDAEIARLRGVVADREATADCAVELMEAAIGDLARSKAEIERLRAANDAWMNGVADLVERFGYDRHAASGPADLLPGLEMFKVVRDGCVYCAGTHEERPVLVCVRCGTGFYQGEQ